MTVHIALLRAVNVGPHGRVAMTDLRELVAQLGFPQVQSLLQSGNLVFTASGKTGAALESLLAAGAAKRLGLRTDFFLRTAREWDAIVANNPFPGEAERDPGHVVVMVLKDAADAKAVAALQAAVKGPEILRADGRQLYIVYPAGIGRSRLTNTLIEKKLGTRGTARNWNTVRKLAELASG
jgi:uncharacterized protein (DUF1697 family)